MGNWFRISLVTKWKPRDLGFSVISTCCIIVSINYPKSGYKFSNYSAIITIFA